MRFRASFARIGKPLALTALLLAAAVNCGKEPTGLTPAGFRLSSGISFITQFPAALRDEAPGSVGLVTFAKVRVVLYREDKTVALDTTITFPAGVEELTVNLQVALSPTSPAAGEPLSLNLKYVNVAGDTVFKGTANVTAAPATTGTPAPQPVTIAVTYTGQGSNAARVIIAPRSIAALTGDPISFTAVAVDAAGNQIANTPIKWSSLDPASATITNAAAGVGIAGATRGNARIVAELLTGPKDTVIVAVQPKASAFAIATGNNQTAVVNTKLPLPVVAKVTGPDGLGVSGTEVKFQIMNGTGGLSSATVLTDASGNASINWTLGTTSGTQTLTATATGLTGSPLTFTATAAPSAASILLVKTQPAATAVAGATLSAVEFSAVDGFGNVATSFTGAVGVSLGGAGSAVLGGTVSANAVAGVARFTTLSVNLVGVGYTLIGAASGLSSVSTNAFSITTAAARSCTATAGNGQSATVNTNVGTNPAVRIADALGNTVKDVLVTWSVTSGGGSVGSASSTSDGNGMATTSWKLGTTAGAQSLTATATGLTGCPLLFTATATTGSATKLAVQTQPAASITAGATMAPVEFNALDAFGNIVTSFNGPVALTLSGGAGSATLGGTVSLNASSGVARFSTLSVNLAGSGYTLNATGTGLTAITTNAFSITAAAAKSCAVSAGNGQSATVNTNVGTNPTLLIADALGNPVKDVPVTWTVTTGGGSVGSASATTDGNGLATTSWKLGTTAGAQSLTVTAAGLTGCPLVFTATATTGAATKLAVQTQPAASITAGATMAAVEFNVLDALGNLVTSFNGPVALTLSGGAVSATLGGTVSLNASAGVARFSTLSVNLVGSGYTLNATGTGLTSITTNAFSITAAAAKSCSVSAGNGQSATVNTNVGTNPAVKITDAFGNAVKDAVVTWAVTTGSGSVGSASSTSDVNGLASTTWKLGTVAGAQSITATAAGLTGCPLVFTATATPGTATQLAVQTPPATSVTAGATIAPVVFVARDGFGNTATSFAGSVSVTLGTSTPTLGGTVTVTAQSGIATFSTLTVTTAGSSYTLTASGTNVTSATTTAFSIVPAAAASCSAWDGNGQTFFAGTLLPTTPKVLVVDAFDNSVTGTSVTWGVASGGGSMGSTITTSVNGFASSAWTLGTAVGAQSMTATCAGVSPATVFTATSMSRGMKLNVSDLVSYAQETVSAGAIVKIPIVLDLTFPEGGNLASISFDLNFDPTRFSFSKTTVGSFGSVLENTSAVGTGKISVGVFSPTKATGQTVFLYTLELVAKSVTSATASAVTATVTAAGKEDGSVATVEPRNLTVTIKP